MFTCHICHNNFHSSHKVVTPCEHQFCSSCITHWLLIKNTCPMCRYDIIPEKGGEGEGEGEEEGLDYYIEYPEPNQHMSFNELQKIRGNYREDIYDLCDDMIEDIQDNNVEYNEKKHCYYMDDYIETREKIIFIDFTFYPDEEKIEVDFTFKHKLKKPFIKQKHNFINHRGKMLNLFKKISR